MNLPLRKKCTNSREVCPCCFLLRLSGNFNYILYKKKDLTNDMVEISNLGDVRRKSVISSFL